MVGEYGSVGLSRLQPVFYLQQICIDLQEFLTIVFLDLS
jgi:hypothetical protein